jgi:hypothetical protein
MSLAPIVLFVYNRPQHTLKTLEALYQNELAEMSELFIFCDGPKADATKQNQDRINKVRELVKKKNWCKKVTIRESHVNKGLADSIVAGVTEIVNTYGKIIVLEDDIVTSKGFLKYMNEALDLYENEPKVMQISGFMVPSKVELEQTGFFRQAASWGWATWNTSWRHYNNQTDVLLKQLKKNEIFQFNIENTYHHFEELLKNDNGLMNTWLIRWYSVMYINKGLCLYPKNSLVTNIGFGRLATHTHSSKSGNIIFTRNNFISELNIDIKREIIEFESYLKAFKEFYVYQNYIWGKPSLKQRIVGKLKFINKKYFTIL